MLLTMKEKNKIEVMQWVMDGRLEVEEAGRVLKRSVRQVYRMLQRLREEGLEGLIHKNKGKSSPRKIRKEIRKKIVSLAQGRLRDINDTQLTELLFREEKIGLSRESVRRILRAEGMSPKRKRRRPKYRSRRERKEAFGMMLQIDASRHDWLEGRGPWITLVGAIDDATSHVWAHFEEAETTWAYLSLMREIFLSEGLPLSLYSDRHTIFFSPREQTIVEQLKGIKPFTQFGRAMQELAIEIIPAYSPQAKGRIERLWNTLQDRLVVELRLAKAKTLEETHAILKRVLQDLNSRFTVPARQQQSVFRQRPSRRQLDRTLCLKEQRTVNKDHTVSFEGLLLQIPPSKKFRSIAAQKVEILQLREGEIEIVYKNQTVARFRPQAITRLLEKNKGVPTELKKVA